jgi:hypothetical protein
VVGAVVGVSDGMSSGGLWEYSGDVIISMI